MDGQVDWLYENPAPGGKTFPFLVEVGNDLDGFWPATARILPLASENLEANLFAAWAGGACPRIRQVVVVDSSGDGDLEPGEAFTAQIMLHNFGQDVAALTGVRLTSEGPYLDLPQVGLEVAGLGPHADTMVTIERQGRGGRPGRDRRPPYRRCTRSGEPGSAGRVP